MLERLDIALRAEREMVELVDPPEASELEDSTRMNLAEPKVRRERTHTVATVDFGPSHRHLEIWRLGDFRK